MKDYRIYSKNFAAGPDFRDFSAPLENPLNTGALSETAALGIGAVQKIYIPS